MLRIKNIKRSPKVGLDFYEKEICQILRLKKDQFNWEIYQESLDARKKDKVFFVAQINVWPKKELSRKFLNKLKNVELVENVEYTFKKVQSKIRPVIVGSGPCGLFAAYILAEAGLKPILLEKGKPVEQRILDVEEFWKSGSLNSSSNVQFGEGGAGTFSDGKLTSRSKDPRGRLILKKFVEFGAPEEILYMKKPHVGTDRLRKVLIKFRKKLLELGCEIRFEEEFLNLKKIGDSYEVKTSKGVYETSALILALGHSARDTFELLYKFGLRMESKPFAVGFRIEQKQEVVNERQYGKKFMDYLPPAEYALTHQSGDIGCYTFCMCPGGYVVGASSEEGHLVVNGMSYKSRNGDNANAAILASIDEEIFGQGVLDGIKFQREIEKKAYKLGGESYLAPVEKVEDFLNRVNDPLEDGVQPTYKPGVKYVDLNQIYPEKINEALREALIAMDEKMVGFSSKGAVLTGVETRSSSPVRLVRDRDNLMSVSHKGIYPAGEGAGYAGGIISSAIDGIRVAEAVLKNI